MDGTYVRIGDQCTRTATHPSELERDDAEVAVEAVLAQVQVVPPLVPLQDHHVVRVLVIW